MNKIILVVILISIFIAGCANKQVKTQSINDNKINNENNSQINSKNSIESTDKNVTKGNDGKNTETLNNRTSKEQKANNTSSTAATAKNNYSDYSGTWVTENNLKNDFKYGMVVSIKIDKDGNLQGEVSDSTENLSHISNVDIKGKIKDDIFIFNFNNDGWEHSGTIKLEFRENNIILTINYSKNSSKDNLWGIGEGTFVLINSNTKVNRTLNNLKDGGLQVIENQSFSVNLENYGKVKFISGLKREDSNDIAVFYLINDKNNVLYKLPDFYGNEKGMLKNIRAVSFNDVNNDELKDIIIIADYKTNFSNSTLSPVCSIYFQKGKEFINNKNFDNKMNASSDNKNISSVLKYAKNNLN